MQCLDIDGFIMTLVIGTLIGGMALGADVGVFYYNWMQLQKAADSAVLAGANYLTGVPSTTDNSQVVGTTNQYAQLNGIKSAEIVSTTVAGDAKSVTILLQRTVPYYFARVLGLSQGIVSVRATAGINDTIAPLGLLPIGLPCTVSDASQPNCSHFVHLIRIGLPREPKSGAFGSPKLLAITCRRCSYRARPWRMP